MNKRRRRLLIYSLAGLLPVRVKAACRITEPNSLGPFYRPDAPFRSVLADASEPGRRLHVAGRVLASDACTLLNGVVVDVWHANEAGRYYNVGADAGSLPQQFRLRGRVRTNQHGEYEFQTIVPGDYAGRPKHIHYVVSHPGAEPFVTQLYFEGDPLLETDWLVRDSLVRPLEADANNAFETSFDVVLKT